MLKRFERACLEYLHLIGEHGFGCRRGVDTARLDRYKYVAAVLEEFLGVEHDDTSLVRLSDVGEDHIDRGEKHAVLVR